MEFYNNKKNNKKKKINFKEKKDNAFKSLAEIEGFLQSFSKISKFVKISKFLKK